MWKQAGFVFPAILSYGENAVILMPACRLVNGTLLMRLPGQ